MTTLHETLPILEAAVPAVPGKIEAVAQEAEAFETSVRELLENLGEKEEQARGLLERVLDASRLVRFVRVTLFYRQLHRETLTESRPTLANRGQPDEAFHVEFAGTEQAIRAERGARRPEDEVRRITHDDLAAMM